MGFGDRSTGRGSDFVTKWGLYGVRVDFRSDAALFPITLADLLLYLQIIVILEEVEVSLAIAKIVHRQCHSFIHSYSFISLYDTPQQTMIQATLLI